MTDTGRRAAAAISAGTTGARLMTASAFVLALGVAAASTASLWDLGNITLRLQETRMTDGVT